MESNRLMQRLLDQFSINPDQMSCRETAEIPTLQLIDGCVFLAEEYAGSKVSNPQLFSDRTGYECYVNHVHFQVEHDKQSLERVFDYASAIRKSLNSLKDGSFEIIISVSDGGSIVRFHKCRPGEVWLSEDLDAYEHEAILSMTVHSY
jgi:hypothetical protein